jgi:nucleotide-binding universal stress UspA family protein
MSHPIRTIVAGVSRAAADDPALAAALELADWTGAELHLVHAFTLPAVFAPPELGYVPPDLAQEYARSRHNALKTAVAKLGAAGSASCHAVPGAPGRTIVNAAREMKADLVVVGAGRGGRLGTTFLGTTAQRVLRAAAAPVLVVRTPPRRPLRRVLVTTDLSEPSAAVHEVGLDTAASLFGAPQSACSLFVLEVPGLPGPAPWRTLNRSARAMLEEFLKARQPRSPGVEPVVRVGEAEAEIAAEAKEWNADLLVVGTHARGWAERLALGSVAEASVRNAPCNVLVVPPAAIACAAAADELPAVQVDSWGAVPPAFVG